MENEPGRIYLLSHPETEYPINPVPNYIFDVVSKLSVKHADEFLTLQEMAGLEIKGGVDKISHEVLVDNNIHYIFDNLYLSVAENNGRLVGYGFGHIELRGGTTYYINTIFVHPDHRNNKLATNILRGLLNKVINDIPLSKINTFKSVIHDDNNNPIKLILAHKFYKCGS